MLRTKMLEDSVPEPLGAANAQCLSWGWQLPQAAGQQTHDIAD